MNKKSLLILTSVVIFGALLVGVYASGVLNFSKSSDTAASLQGDFGSGATNIESIYGSLNNAIASTSSDWKAEMQNGQITLVDTKSQNQVATISKVSDNEISIRSVVASLGALPAEQKTNVSRQIDEFNMSSSVGTMKLQPNGDVTMEHKLNPRENNADQIAKVAVTFGDKTRQQAQKYGVMKLAANS